MSVLLSINNLSVALPPDADRPWALQDLSLELHYNEILCVVGESGSGKSMTASAIMGLLPERVRATQGRIDFEKRDLLRLSEAELRRWRGARIGMIFQDPMTALNPLQRVGDQIAEMFFTHRPRLAGAEVNKRVLRLLEDVQLPDPATLLRAYPHQLSGGQRQRVMIAMALACEPDILIADEPTTALDVTIQAQILELMQELQHKLGMAIIIVTHDLGVIADMCDEIIVMYGGRVCERGTADDIFYEPAHEYTKGLLRSIPTAGNTHERLQPIGGTPINLLNMPEGCAFCTRCDNAMKICLTQVPEELQVGEHHRASCWMNVKQAMEEAAK